MPWVFDDPPTSTNAFGRTETTLMEEKDRTDLAEVVTGQLRDRLGPLGYATYGADVHYRLCRFLLASISIAISERASA
jgi:hypothetical protein